MKKGIVRYNWIHCPKWIVTWTVLIFIISFISLSVAGSGKETESHESAGINLDSKIVTEKYTFDGETIGRSTEIDTGTVNGIDNQKRAVKNLEIISEASSGTDSRESTEEDLEAETGSEKNVYNWESIETNIKAETGMEKDTESRESIEKSTEIETETKQNTGNQENLEEDLETKKLESISIDNQEDSEEDLRTKIEAKKDTNNQQSIEKNPDTRIRAEKDTANHEQIEGNLEKQTDLEIKAGAKDYTANQDNIQENPETKLRVEKSTENQEYIKESLDTETEVNNEKDYQENVGKNLEKKTKTELNKDNQENTRKNLETGKKESSGTDNLVSSCRDPEQKEEIKEGPGSEESSKADLKLKTSANYYKYSSENYNTKTEIETGYCDGSKNLKIIKVKTEPKIGTCSGIKSSKSGETKLEAEKEACNQETSLKTGGKRAEIKICGTKWTYIPGCKELKPELETGLWSGFPEERLENKELKPELENEESSWNNLKLILSYPCSLRSFYTTRESVKINYRGSEVLKEQKVDIYLVKTCNSSSSEEAVKNVKNCSTIRFEDIFNKNTEFYIQIPATLNEYGNLSPLRLGPLPEGSYWILVTLAGNETKADKPEKTILLANYLEVLRYEMEAEAPHTLEAGKDFEVKLDLKNVPAQENCTYWAVLIKEDACRTNASSGDTNGTKAVSWTFVQELRLLRDFGLNSTNNESGTGKDEFKSKIKTLIGQGNGTISIGEENQSILTLKSLGLAPGNYLLFAGAYEKEKGLAGMAQEKLTISPVRKEDSDLKSYSDAIISAASLPKSRASCSL